MQNIAASHALVTSGLNPSAPVPRDTPHNTAVPISVSSNSGANLIDLESPQPPGLNGLMTNLNINY